MYAHTHTYMYMHMYGKAIASWSQATVTYNHIFPILPGSFQCDQLEREATVPIVTTSTGAPEALNHWPHNLINYS